MRRAFVYCDRVERGLLTVLFCLYATGSGGEAALPVFPGSSVVGYIFGLAVCVNRNQLIELVSGVCL